MELIKNITLGETVAVLVLLAVIGKILHKAWKVITETHDMMQRYKDNNDKVEKISEGILGLLQFRLYTQCREIIAKGQRTEEETEVIDRLYPSYHALGGNGTGTDLYDTAKEQTLIVGR